MVSVSVQVLRERLAFSWKNVWLCFQNTIFPCLIFLEACVGIGVNHIQNKWRQAFIFPPRRLPERRAPRHSQPQAVIKLRHASLFSVFCLFFLFFFFNIRFQYSVRSKYPAGHLLQSLLMWLLTPSSYIKCCVNCNIHENIWSLLTGGFIRGILTLISFWETPESQQDGGNGGRSTMPLMFWLGEERHLMTP